MTEEKKIFAIIYSKVIVVRIKYLILFLMSFLSAIVKAVIQGFEPRTHPESIDATEWAYSLVIVSKLYLMWNA